MGSEPTRSEMIYDSLMVSNSPGEDACTLHGSDSQPYDSMVSGANALESAGCGFETGPVDTPTIFHSIISPRPHPASVLGSCPSSHVGAYSSSHGDITFPLLSETPKRHKSVGSKLPLGLPGGRQVKWC